jgi:hypothetical protein
MILSVTSSAWFIVVSSSVSAGRKRISASKSMTWVQNFSRVRSSLWDPSKKCATYRRPTNSWRCLPNRRIHATTRSSPQIQLERHHHHQEIHPRLLTFHRPISPKVMCQNLIDLRYTRNCLLHIHLQPIPVRVDPLSNSVLVDHSNQSMAHHLQLRRLTRITDREYSSILIITDGNTYLQKHGVAALGLHHYHHHRDTLNLQFRRLTRVTDRKYSLSW